MPKKTDNAFLEGGLDAIALCTRISVCAGEPTDFSDIATRTLATTTLAPADFTIADGDTNGRKVTIAQQSDVNVDNAGNADHVVIDDGTNMFVTTCATLALVSGSTVNLPAFDIEIADPV